MDPRDRGWMKLPRWSDVYNDGVNDFLDKAMAKGARGNQICCPCKKCCFRYWFQRDGVYDHLIAFGFTDGYDEWIFHGEEPSSGINVNDDDDHDFNEHDDIDGLLHDTFERCTR
ncbi:hypothetical protein Dimus_020546 [Dionaea muscipula]